MRAPRHRLSIHSGIFFRGAAAGDVGSADVLEKRIVCVFYGAALADLDPDEDGVEPLESLNFIDINDLDTYLRELKTRVGEP